MMCIALRSEGGSGSGLYSGLLLAEDTRVDLPQSLFVGFWSIGDIF